MISNDFAVEIQYILSLYLWTMKVTEQTLEQELARLLGEKLDVEPTIYS